MSEKGTIEIHTRNIFPIIKKWLYSEREIFLRELVSNSMDAITKLKILANRENIQLGEENFRVDVTVDKEQKTITVSDNGIGMNASEIKEYLAQIAFSGAEAFLEKYKTEGEAIIGHFGLGFYSAFMVSNKVTVESKSYREEDEGVRWTCDGEPEYELEPLEMKQRGTTVTLHISDEEAEFLDTWKIRDILRRYCRFLPFELHLGEERINPDPPLWTRVAGEIKEEEYEEFFTKMFPGDKKPHFWVHINADYPFKLQGILYFPHLDRHDDIMRGDKLHLYCNRVFVSSEMNMLLPEALSYLRGFIDSPDIPLNVSRSFLQSDHKVRKIAAFLTRKIADRLMEMRGENEENYLKMWENINPYIKLAAMRDQKFSDRVEDAIVFEKSKGPWVSIDQLLTEAYGEGYKEDKETEHHIYYAVPGETINSLINLYNDTAHPVIKAEPPIDSHFFQHLEAHHVDLKLKFKRIDSELGDELLAESPPQIVDQNGETGKDRIKKRIEGILTEPEIKVEWLKSNDIPLVLIFPEFERRFREMTSAMPNMDQMFGSHTAVINGNHDLIKRLDTAHREALNDEQAAEVMTHIYNLALLPHKKLEPQILDDLFVKAGKLLAHLSGDFRPDPVITPEEPEAE
ncbi:molecular chaperone HtpG [Myxococcota bacterium]|nr:molecular chaperone HtpG [Myxococcota bacterium]MBU1533850.1 molecular chaperone HtpG [Myxococcota bacterium]